ncbi:MAG: carboxylating nicotinate-nucleotide diphosphorylase [Gemmatimonadaceae bacterium]|nr:carboxylating nicotinate-nucleotide diphosphorylase [Gemmatimonadaceae bacterium]
MSPYHPPLRPTPPHSMSAVSPQTITPLGVPAVSPSPLMFPLSAEEITAQVRVALLEDEAFNDVSTVATVVSGRHVRCAIVSRRDGVISGVAMAVEAFKQLDPNISIRVDADDGTRVRGGTTVMVLSGHARGILSAERTALNYMQHLSGIASLTWKFVQAIEGTNAQILDTRKTTPGWRHLEKFAVRCGGGLNHRMDLRSGVLIKDNHLAAIGGDIATAVSRARQLALPGTPVQVECDTIDQVEAAVAAGADWVLLDNMSPERLRDAVQRCAGRCITEASGGVSLDTVRAIAETGVDRISIGALTHSAPALDLGLDFDGL